MSDSQTTIDAPQQEPAGKPSAVYKISLIVAVVCVAGFIAAEAAIQLHGGLG